MVPARTRARLLALVPVVAVVAACGGGGSASTPASSVSSAGPASSAAPTPSATSSAAADAKALLADAQKAFRGADAVRLKGTMVDAGDTMKLDILMTGSGDSEAIIGFAGQGTVKIRTIGKDAYVSGDDKFWKNAGLPAGVLRGKWIKTKTTSSDFKDLLELTSLDKWAENLTPDGDLTVVEGKDFDGVKTVGLDDQSDAVFYVAADGDHRPIAIIPKKASDGALKFTQWNEPVTIEVPPASSIVKA